MPTNVEIIEAQVLAKCVLLFDRQFCLEMKVYAFTVWWARDVTTCRLGPDMSKGLVFTLSLCSVKQIDV